MRRFALRFGMHWTVPITDGSPWQLSQIITIHTKKRFWGSTPKSASMLAGIKQSRTDADRNNHSATSDETVIGCDHHWTCEPPQGQWQ